MTLADVEIGTRILGELALVIALFVGWGTWRTRA
jgi:hypothetical protein